MHAGLAGSYVKLQYDEVSAERLKGQVEVYVAANEETKTLDFDIDLQAAAEEIARKVKELTDIEVSDEAPPEELPQAKAVASPLGKSTGRPESSVSIRMSGVLVPLLFPLLGFTMMVVMVQVLELVMLVMVETLLLVTEAMVIAMFSPFLLMAELLRCSIEEPTTTVSFSLLGPEVVFIHALFD